MEPEKVASKVQHRAEDSSLNQLAALYRWHNNHRSHVQYVTSRKRNGQKYLNAASYIIRAKKTFRAVVHPNKHTNVFPITHVNDSESHIQTHNLCALIEQDVLLLIVCLAWRKFPPSTFNFPARSRQKKLKASQAVVIFHAGVCKFAAPKKNFEACPLSSTKQLVAH